MIKFLNHVQCNISMTCNKLKLREKEQQDFIPLIILGWIQLLKGSNWK